MNMLKDSSREISLNRDTGLLKLLACLFMLSDHLGKMIFPNVYTIKVTGTFAFLLPSSNIMRAFGRLAMPLFAYCIAVGCLKTRNIWKYVLRLFLMAVLVQPLYQAAMGHVTIGTFDWLHDFWRVDLIYEHYYAKNLCILFTLSLAAFVIACYRTNKYPLMVLAVLLVWYLRSRLDYGYKAVTLIVLFYAFIDKPLASFMAVFTYMLWWAMPRFAEGNTSTSSQLYAILSLALIYIPMPRRVMLPKWAFYAFYPAHLLVIYLLQLI